MRWVDNKDYVGADRRKRQPRLRFGERRHMDETREATSVVLLRQLRVRAVAADTPNGVATFVRRARAVAGYVGECGDDYTAATLVALAARVEREPETDWRVRLDQELSWLAERLET